MQAAITRAALLTILITPPLGAQQPPGGGPPPEAFSACRQASQGDDCSFSAPHGRVSGICRSMQGRQLICVPAGGPPRRSPPGSSGITRPRGSVGERAAPPHAASKIASSNPSALPVKGGIPDTRQGSCFDERGLIPCPAPGEPFYGQDAHYLGAPVDYSDNRDGTISDTVTGLMWQQGHNNNRLSWRQADRSCRQLRLGGHRDWRLPNIKELFSIADFTGAVGRQPYLHPLFEIREPDASILKGDRFAASHHTSMMGQTWSSTLYTGDHYGRPGVKAAFFFNFLDGRIKQAPIEGRMELFYRCVRGDPWGENRLQPNSDGTVTDLASGLTWQQQDDGERRIWRDALAHCQQLRLGGDEDWRLPNIKELQSIVDYSLHDPALDTLVFSQQDRRGWFWSSTTLGEDVRQAAYICFGKCTSVTGVDVHGAGAQRSDPKNGRVGDYSAGMGGQQDEVRIRNYVRCVRSEPLMRSN